MTAAGLITLSSWATVLMATLTAAVCIAIFAFSSGSALMARLAILALVTQGVLVLSLVQLAGPMAFVDGQLENVLAIRPLGRSVFLALG